MNYTQNQAGSINETRLFSTLSIGGVPQEINKYLGTLDSTKNLPPGKIQITTVPFEWFCGQTLSFENILVVWEGNGAITESSTYTDKTYNKAQCEFGESTYFAAPLAVQFEYKACKVGTNNTVSFTSTTNGGTEPYSYSWDFGDGTSSTAANPTHTYTTTGNTAILTVTDSKGVHNNYSLPINTPAELTLSETHVDAGCNGSATGSINLEVTGGKTTYSYSWKKNGSAYATSQDLTGLGAGIYIVTVTDSNDCQKELTVTINAIDATKPSIICAADVNVGTNTACTYIGTIGTATATDNCTASNAIVITNNAPAAFPIGSTTVTWTATDAAGKFATCTQTVTVSDDDAPILTCPANATLNTNIACTYVGTIGTATATDNCDSSVTVTNNAPAAFPIGTTTVTWTATDDAGNATTCTQTVTISDDDDPILTCPANATLNTNTACTYVGTIGTATATDNCDSSVTVTNNAPAAFPIGTTTVTWTATDDAGNATTCTQTVTVSDDDAPVITEAGENTTIYCPNLPVFTPPTATDNCGIATINIVSDIITPGSCSSTYSRTITWDATDENNNHSKTVSQTINVEDITAPTFNVPANITLNAGENCAVNLNPDTIGTVTNISDACDDSPTVTYIDSECFGNFTESSVNAGTGNYFNFEISGYDDLTAKNIQKVALAFETNQGKGRVEFTLVSPSGQAVVLVGPYCNGGDCDTSNPGNTELYLPDFYPNNSGYTQWNNSNAITSGVSVNVIPNGNLSATNTINNVTSYVSSFEDLTGPMNGTWFIYGKKVGNELGNIRFKSVCLTPISTCPSNKVISRIWTVTDECGNAASAQQTIKIQDITAPVIALLPATSTISCPAMPEFTQAIATDNCSSNVNLTSADVTTNGDCANSYSVTRTWTATDACGNTSTASQTINVQDITAPVIDALPEVTTINCPDTPEFAVATATDECGSTFSLTSADVTTNGACAGSYSVTRTWTATDACGNTATASQTINVQDITAPVIEALPETSTINCPATPEFAVAKATDECGSTFSLTSADVTTNGACAGSYSVTRTWTATDACGNTATASQTINVQDTTAPEFVIANLPNVTGQCSATITVAPTAIDACAGTITATTTDPLAYSTQGTHTVTWTYNDGNGNTASQTQTVVIEDTYNPTITAPATVEVVADAETGEATDVILGKPTTADNCSVASVTNDAPLSFPIGETTVTWTVTDGNGNTATATQTVIVIDSTQPVIATLPETSTIDCTETPVFADAIATDTSGFVDLTYEDVTTKGECEGSYSVTRTWTATDDNGNISYASQTINVQDTVAPTTTTAFETTVTANCDAIPAVPELVFVDNCSSVAPAVYTETITNSTPSSYSIVREWSVSDACGNASLFTQTVNVTIANSLTTITSDACNGDSSTIDLMNLLPQGTPTNGTWIDTNTTSTLNGSIFSPSGLPLGSVSFEYKINDETCPRSIVLNISINDDCDGTVLGCGAILVHNAFSPNGDALNEKFVIDNIEDTTCYPENTVEIYNRSGVLVFETKNYNNESNYFDGTSKGRTTISASSGLPTGTYFYILNYTSVDNNNNIVTNKKDGYLYLSK